MELAVSKERCHGSRSRLARRSPAPVRGRKALSILVSASRDAHESAAPSASMSTCDSILLPDQFLAERDGETRSTRLLMIAVLRDAISCFRNHLLDPSRRGRRLYGEAESWLQADDASTPLGFETICDALDLDAGYVRGRLYEWRRREIARAHPACGRRAS